MVQRIDKLFNNKNDIEIGHEYFNIKSEKFINKKES